MPDRQRRDRDGCRMEAICNLTLFLRAGSSSAAPLTRTSTFDKDERIELLTPGGAVIVMAAE